MFVRGAIDPLMGVVMGIAKRHGSVILLELNELSPVLMRRFMSRGELTSFSRLHAESHALTTDAEESPPNLEPWIQWVTVHSGLPFAEHRIFLLGDGHRLAQPCIWDAASAAGRPVWVCGSMNIRHDTSLLGCVLPDPWTCAVSPRPVALEPFRRFVREHVLEHTSDRVPLPRAEYARFAAFMAAHGLRPATARAIVDQLLSERGGRYRWRRAALLDKLQHDLFEFYYRRLRPGLSTFFLNSTAHFQHMYWRNMEPERFEHRPTDEDQADHGDAIRFGYREMDRIVGRFLDLADEENATLIFATALSQKPCLIYEARGGKVIHRARDLRALLDLAGVKGDRRNTPVMSTDFHLEFSTDEEAAVAAQRLSALRIGDREAMSVDLEGDALTAGPTSHPVPEGAILSSPVTGRSAPFFELFYRAQGLKSGMHHPDGLLWIRLPSREHAEHRRKVSLTSIAPTVLRLLGVPRPPSMRGAPIAEVLA